MTSRECAEPAICVLKARGTVASPRPFYDISECLPHVRRKARKHVPNHFISMARTTGYTCTAVANLVLDGKYDRKGISPPEYVGEVDGALEFVLGYLGERGVVYRKTV